MYFQKIVSGLNDISNLLDEAKMNDFTVVSEAKLPVIRGRHSNLDIDLTMENIFGLNNSHFLRKYGKNPHLRLLVQIVKTWAKNKGFSGTSHLSSYALTLMVIHFYVSTPPHTHNFKVSQK